jgi:hypothetical protein
MEIHKDHNGLRVESIEKDETTGEDTRGHSYDIISGGYSDRIDFKRVGKDAPGITNEALLAILINRIEFLNSKHPCFQNSLALINLKASADLMEQRTLERIDRGVEGKEVA